MENRAHAIIAILFFSVFVAVAVAIFWWLSSGPRDTRAYRIVTSESVAGLAPQARVEFKGLVVGHVSRIGFDPRDPSKVVIDFNVRRDAYVTHATYAQMATRGLTGGDVLELKLGNGSAAPLATRAAKPALIPMRKGLLATLEASAQQDLQDVHVVLASAKQLLDSGNRQHLAATLRQLDAATARLVTIENALTPALRQMPALAASARKSLDQSHALLANANRLAQSARVPIARAGSVVDTYRQLGHGLATQTAPDVDSLARSLARTSRQLEQLLRELQANPQSVIFGPPRPQPGPGEPGFRAGDKQGHGHE